MLRLRSASGRTALLVGDLEAGQEQALLRELGPVALQSEWLLVPQDNITIS